MKDRRCRTTTDRVLLAVGLSGLLAATAPMVFVQSNDATEPPPEPIVTDRPTDTASPLLVPRSTFQLEAGRKFSRAEGEAGSTDVRVLPDLLARYGINERFEARLVAAGWTVQSGPDRRTSGFADVSPGTKIALAEEHGSRPQMALLVDVSLPVGSSISGWYLSLGAVPRVRSTDIRRPEPPALSRRR